MASLPFPACARGRHLAPPMRLDKIWPPCPREPLSSKPPLRESWLAIHFSIQARELEELTQIYVDRGLPCDLAHQVAVVLTEKDVIRAHARDELGGLARWARLG
jgi:hypothetical protein